MRIEHSRGLRLTEGVSQRKTSELEHALEDSRVVISVDPTLPRALLTARVLLTTLRRMPGELQIIRGDISASSLEALTAAVTAIDPERGIAVVAGVPERLSARVHVGATCPTESIRLVPEASGAHVAGLPSAVIRPRVPATSLGAVYTAALGAAEVFKRVADVKPDRRTLHRHLRFCPVSLSSNLGVAADASLAGGLDLALIGVGAIGTGVALLLAELDVEGTLLAVDRQRFALENRGTYSLGGAAEVAAAPWKVDIAATALPHFTVIRYRDPVEQLPEAVDAGLVPWFPTVICGLDSPEARRAAQRLWPDRLIDAATGDTFVGLHDHRYGVDPCMVCLFPPYREGPSAAARLAELSGLPVELLIDGDELLREEHLATLTNEQRQRVAHGLGKPVCGLAETFGLTSFDAGGSRPSIPFVSLQAACLAIGRLVAARNGISTPANFVQYDALIGPQEATLEVRRRTRGCRCETRADVIARVREMRSAQQGAA